MRHFRTAFLKLAPPCPQVFLLHPPLHVRDNDVVHGSILMTRSKTNHRLMDVVIKHAIGKGAETASNFHIE